MQVTVVMTKDEHVELSQRARSNQSTYYAQLVNEIHEGAMFIPDHEAVMILDAIGTHTEERVQINTAFCTSAIQCRLDVLQEKYHNVAAGRLLRYLWVWGRECYLKKLEEQAVA